MDNNSLITIYILILFVKKNNGVVYNNKNIGC